MSSDDEIAKCAYMLESETFVQSPSAAIDEAAHARVIADDAHLPRRIGNCCERDFAGQTKSEPRLGAHHEPGTFSGLFLPAERLNLVA